MAVTTEHTCKLLRTKPVPSPAGMPLDMGGSTNAFWCLKTMTTAGPDQGLAVPEFCTAARACFEPRADTSR